MNSTYTEFFGPDAPMWDNCPLCQSEVKRIGPEHGPDRPSEYPKPNWMIPEEWAGGDIAVQNSPW